MSTHAPDNFGGGTDVEIVPGTEIMRDTADKHFVHAHNSSGGTVLVPQPTASPHDPLNWSTTWKLLALANQAASTIFVIIPSLSIAPLSQVYMAEFDTSLTRVAYLTGVIVIILGYMNFIVVPLATIFGRRPVSIICAIIVLVSNIWQGAAQSYGSFMGARVIAGLGGATAETMMPIVVCDLFFLHERGFWMGVYFLCYFGGTLIGPIIAGAITAGVGWRWFFWLCTILQGVNCITLLFTFPETSRDVPFDNSSAQVEDVRVPRDPNVVAMDSFAGPAKDISAASITEKSTSSSEHVENLAAPVQASEEYLDRGKPSRKQFNIFQYSRFNAKAVFIHHLITPIRLAFIPIVFWACLCMCFGAITLFLVNLMQAQALAPPPYAWTSSNIGMSNFAMLVGGVLGLFCSGPLSDWLAMRATRKNNYIREPEMRLLALVPFMILGVIGMVVTGVGFDKHWPWQAVVVVGFGAVGMVSVGLPTVAVTYAIDSYRPIGNYNLVTATVFKNTFAYDVLYQHWAAEKGFTPPYMMVLALTVGIPLIGTVLFRIWGKSFRRRTRDSSVHKLM